MEQRVEGMEQRVEGMEQRAEGTLRHFGSAQWNHRSGQVVQGGLLS
jgi:hypothetical protein